MVELVPTEGGAAPLAPAEGVVAIEIDAVRVVPTELMGHVDVPVGAIGIHERYAPDLQALDPLFGAGIREDAIDRVEYVVGADQLGAVVPTVEEHRGLVLG